MLVAIPEVPETSHPQPPITSSTTTTTTPPTTATPRHHPHHLLLNNNNNLHAAKPAGALHDGGDKGREVEGNGAVVGGEAGGGLLEKAVVGMGMEGVPDKMEMKPPVSATIPKSRNNRRTPPTPPAMSPSPPPALTTPAAARIDVHFAATATGRKEWGGAQHKLTNGVLENNPTKRTPQIEPNNIGITFEFATLPLPKETVVVVVVVVVVVRAAFQASRLWKPGCGRAVLLRCTLGRAGSVPIASPPHRPEGHAEIGELREGDALLPPPLWSLNPSQFALLTARTKNNPANTRAGAGLARMAAGTVVVAAGVAAAYPGTKGIRQSYIPILVWVAGMK
ncbi:hypothetical protein O3P69_002987 [Scylla paramamosain]|uniref:Uncharacterized protein n=1 Tax=Scylla paramamosain TaxID=85552 RepID=A0AAW0UK13_SCYPA